MNEERHTQAGTERAATGLCSRAGLHPHITCSVSRDAEQCQPVMPVDHGVFVGEVRASSRNRGRMI